ncbi:MAG TPA: ATP-binding protein [Gaiellaceae bacterium]|nr:ATP-binding protein [Gaiellaceae bacterium]
MTNDNGTSASVSLVIPAKAEYIALGRLALTGLLRSRAVEPEVLADVKLALTEACSNSIRHAYANGGGDVVIRYELDGGRLAVEICDDGDGFDPDRALAGHGELDEGGLGIAIIRAVTDELEIGACEDGRGSRLRFTKHLA